MALNHLNLAVPDVTQSREFFETYFGFRRIGEQRGTMIAVLRDESGLVLTLSNFEKVTEVNYPEGFHIGFIQESEERVNKIHQRLKDDGFEVESPRKFHGSWTFYMRAPGGIPVEVLC